MSKKKEVDKTVISWQPNPKDLVKHFQYMIDDVVMREWKYMNKQVFLAFLTKQRLLIEDWTKRYTRDLEIIGVEE